MSLTEGRGDRARAWRMAMLLLTLAYAGMAQAMALPILVYHRFGPVAEDSMTVRTGTLEAQLQQLEDKGYRVIPLRRLVDHLVAHGPPPPPRSVVLTVDDGHRTVYTELLPVVRRHRIPVTLFVYPSAISNAPYALTWEQLAELRATGLFDIQSHSYWHPLFFREERKLDPEGYARFVDMQLSKSKQVLESRLGCRVDLLAWPFGLHDADLSARAARSGYVAAFTLERRAVREGDDPLALPRFLITDAVDGKAFAAILSESNGDGGKR
jgi:peptidoglycan/xylan/chitin deacetylase (PgdA/CDA1 family)